MIRTVLRTLLAAVLLLPTAWAQEAAMTRRAVELRQAPGDQAPSLATLPAQTAVTRTNERQGPWVQVRAAGGLTGWVHLFDIGPAAAPAAGGSVAGNALRSVTSLFGGGGTRPTQTTISTSGIRGLGAEDIAQAQPNPGAVTQMEAQRQGEADVRSFADRSGWRPAPVEPLPQPASVFTAPANPNAGQPQSP
jgi:hypothetical protein